MMREVIAILRDALHENGLDDVLPEDVAFALDKANEAGFVQFKLEEVFDILGDIKTMAHDFNYYGFGRGQKNAAEAVQKLTAMIEASQESE